MNSKYFIYMVRCSDNSIYTGITTNYQRRFKEHKAGTSSGAKYTRSHTIKVIEVIWETSLGRGMASRLEYKIKSLTKAQKEELIKNPIRVNELVEDGDFKAVPYSQE